MKRRGQQIAGFLVGMNLLASCSADRTNTQKLTSHPWLVEEVQLEAKNLQIDSALADSVKNMYTGRTYEFSEDGHVRISDGKTTFAAKWNFGAVDSKPLFKDLGSKDVFIVLRSDGEDMGEAWMATAGGTIFVNYGDKEEDDRINAVLVPAPRSGVSVYLFLKTKI